jgi:hypothetical protein
VRVGVGSVIGVVAALGWKTSEKVMVKHPRM